MLSDFHYQIWLKEFQLSGIDYDIASEEYRHWAEGLDGERDNEFTQTDYSVSAAAQNAISELKLNDSMP